MYVCLSPIDILYELQPQNFAKITTTSYISYGSTEDIFSFCIMIVVANVGMVMMWDDDCVYVIYVYQYGSTAL